MAVQEYENTMALKRQVTMTIENGMPSALKNEVKRKVEE